jgi:hypothetical protein
MAWRIAANMVRDWISRRRRAAEREKYYKRRRYTEFFGSPLCCEMTAAEFSFYLTRRSLAWLWAIAA